MSPDRINPYGFILYVINYAMLLVKYAWTTCRINYVLEVLVCLSLHTDSQQLIKIVDLFFS